MIGTASEDGLTNNALRRGKDRKFECSCGVKYYSMENVKECENNHTTTSSFIEEEEIEMDMANAGYSSYSLQ